MASIVLENQSSFDGSALVSPVSLVYGILHGMAPGEWHLPMLELPEHHTICRATRAV